MNKLTVFTAIMLLMALATACKKDGSSRTAAKPEYYFSGEIAGKQIRFEVEGDDYACAPFEQDNSAHPHYDYYEGTVVGEANDVLKNNMVVTVLKYFNHQPSPTELFRMMKKGELNFGSGEETNSTVNGAVIMYLDEKGRQWSSELGPQNGSKFSILEVSSVPGSAIQKVFKASFSCKLYDPSGSKSIQINNGVVRGLVF